MERKKLWEMEYSKTQDRQETCLHCGGSFGYGRVDKKFCCEECKNTYHNMKRKERRFIKLRIQNALNKNYSILEKLIAKGISNIDLYDLKLLGYNLEYMTSSRKIRNHTEVWCYEIRFTMTETQIKNIRRMDSLIYEESTNIKRNR